MTYEKMLQIWGQKLVMSITRLDGVQWMLVNYSTILGNGYMVVEHNPKAFRISEEGSILSGILRLDDGGSDLDTLYKIMDKKVEEIRGPSGW